MASPRLLKLQKLLMRIWEVLENYLHSPSEGPDSDPEYENEDMDTSVDYGGA